MYVYLLTYLLIVPVVRVSLPLRRLVQFLVSVFKFCRSVNIFDKNISKSFCSNSQFQFRFEFSCSWRSLCLQVYVQYDLLRDGVQHGHPARKHLPQHIHRRGRRDPGVRCRHVSDGSSSVRSSLDWLHRNGRLRSVQLRLRCHDYFQSVYTGFDVTS